MTPGFAAFVVELFAPLGPVSIRKMFGGAGVYAEGRMFALLADDVLYLKVDEAMKVDLTAEGSGPFVWTPPSGARAPIEMSYWRMPDAAMDEPARAIAWGRRALSAALAAPAPKRKSARKARKP